jgi:hypothetical protein
MLTGESYVIGEADLYEEQQAVLSEYDLGHELLLTPDSGAYVYTETYAAIDFDGLSLRYALFLNEYPCDILSQSAGRIDGALSFTFYDLAGLSAAEVKLSIVFAFYFDKTVLTVKTTDSAEEIAYFLRFAESSGLKFKIITLTDVNETIPPGEVTGN